MSKLLQSANFYRIVRNPNVHAVGSRVYDRDNIFDNTLKILEDPVNNRKLYLIGTMNASDLLAQRTEKMLSEINYSSLLVQTNQNWFDHVNRKRLSVEVNILSFLFYLIISRTEKSLNLHFGKP